MAGSPTLEPVLENETNAYLPAIELETGANPQFSVIWLHGLGADGSDFVPVVDELGLDGLPAIRFIFPHAPQMPVTCNAGYIMPSWYDIYSLEINSRRIDEDGILASRQAIRQLIARENQRGVPCSHIVIAGFSQGGAVAYTTALTQTEALAGVIALSTYIPAPNLLAEEATPANQRIPIFAAHGRDDDVVAPVLGAAAREWLAQHDYAVEWHEYPMPHSVCLEEIGDIGQWLRQRMTSKNLG